VAVVVLAGAMLKVVRLGQQPEPHLPIRVLMVLSQGRDQVVRVAPREQFLTTSAAMVVIMVALERLVEAQRQW
jgi:hypothetical protein